MRLRSKFIVLGVFVSVLVLALVLVNVWASSQKMELARQLRMIATITQRHMTADMMHDAIRADVLSAVLAEAKADAKGMETSKIDLEEHAQKFRENLEANRKEALPAEIKKSFDGALSALENYAGAALMVIEKAQRNEPVDALVVAFDEKFSLMETENEQISDKIASWAEKEEASAQVISDRVELASWILSLIALLGVAYVPVFAHRQLFVPLSAMMAIMERIAKGDYNLDVEGADRSDEIGDIAQSVLVFKQNGLQRIALEKEQQAQAAQVEAQQKQAILAQEERIAHEVSGVIEACAAGDFTKRLNTSGREGLLLMLCEGMNRIGDACEYSMGITRQVISQLAEGNLTQRMQGEHKGTFNDIQVALNSTIERLHGMMQKVGLSAESINNASSEITAASDDLARRTEAQASSLEETSAEMDSLFEIVRKNADGALEASGLSKQASQVADEGKGAVLEVMHSIEDINHSSRKVAEIVNVIDEIAFQTNLLALNAAVEAARAGEAGKGFAVVASEVRALAGRSASASKEIRDLIQVSMDKVLTGTQLAKKAGEIIERIVGSVNDTDAIIADIAKSSKEQAGSIEQIKAAVNDIDESTQQNAAMVEENSGAARSLLDQVIQLRNLTSFFKTK